MLIVTVCNVLKFEPQLFGRFCTKSYLRNAYISRILISFRWQHFALLLSVKVLKAYCVTVLIVLISGNVYKSIKNRMKHCQMFARLKVDGHER